MATRYIIQINKRFGKKRLFGLLTVIQYVEHRKGRDYWLCSCTCGKYTIVQGRSLLSGSTKSCGCITSRKNIKNKRFGKLIVLKFSHVNRFVYWVCHCDCGNEVIVNGSNLRNGTTKSCGCLVKERQFETHFKHGQSHTKFHCCWSAMKRRCLNSNNAAYKNYGGRGIEVCDRWMKFENFKDDMWESYQKHIEEFGEKNTTLDRKNVNGNYKKSNCKWSSYIEQNRNRRDSVKSNNYKEHNLWRRRFFNLIHKVIHNYKIRYSSVFVYFGVSLDDFRKYLESKFKFGMSWDNYGNNNLKWCVDHIIPCNKFDLSKEEDRKKCFHYTNLQPLWWEDNNKKKQEDDSDLYTLCNTNK